MVLYQETVKGEKAAKAATLRIIHQLTMDGSNSRSVSETGCRRIAIAVILPRPTAGPR